MDIRVITVTYNSADCIRDCIQSVLSQTGVQAEIVVVDNASHDATVDRVNDFAEQVHLLKNPDNVGFGPRVTKAPKTPTAHISIS